MSLKIASPQRNASLDADVVAALDHALFDPKHLFALGADNRRVPDVLVLSVREGLRLVGGQGDVATFVGRLRPELVVVDVDLSGVAGFEVTRAVAAWAAARGLWHLVRPSGGAPGRAHVFIAHGGAQEELGNYLAGLRAKHRSAAASIDMRRAVRPLSAPHRNGTSAAPVAAAAALTALEQLAWYAGPPQRATARRRAPRTPSAPRRRERRELPQAWALFLATGQRPRLRPGGDHSRSTYEAIATGMMLRAGWSADEAWEAILTAHPQAMDKARCDRRRWVKYVWNRAVSDDAAYAAPTDPHVDAAIAYARTRLRSFAWALPTRQRHSLLLVGHALLDRMARTGAMRVPCPERNLVLDTGLTDRTTVRAQLRLLDGQLGTLHRCFDWKKRATSSFEFEIPPRPVSQGAVLSPRPPGLHTPLPTLPADAPASCAHLLRALYELPDCDLPSLAEQAQLTPSPGRPLSPAQVRTVRAGLEALGRLGLAQCSAQGTWVACEPPAVVRRSELAAQIATQRATFRAGTSTWDSARAAVLKANRAREKAWWDGLDPGQRAERRLRWQGEFAALSLVDAAKVKEDLALRDVAAGVDVVARHAAWVDAQGEALVARSIERAADFARLSRPLQLAYAHAWAQHRDRFAIPRGTPAWRVEMRAALPDSAASCDGAFMQDALPQLAIARFDAPQLLVNA